MKTSVRLLLALPSLVTTLHAAVPLSVNYQGAVYDSAGTAIGASAAVNRKVIFRLYDASTAGNKLWTEEQTVTIYKGEFSVVLGNGTVATGTASTESRPALDTVFTSNSTTRYLEVMVDNGDNTITATDTPISPRQLITTTFYAFHAQVAEAIASSTDLTINPVTGTASNYGLGWYGTGRLWGGSTAVDGPVLYGNAGGALGSNASGARNTALLWNATGQVGIGATATFTANNKLTLQGDDTATATTAAKQLIIRGNTDSNEALYLGFDTTNNRATLQSYTNASTTTGGPLLLNPSGGNVGIGTGTTAPIAKLTVEGSVSATGSGGYVFGTGGDADGGLFSPVDGILTLKTNGNERLRIDSSGKVGVGTTNPNVALDVTGAITASGGITGASLTTTGNIAMSNDASISALNSTTGAPEAAFWPRSNNGTYLNYGSAGFYIRNSSSASKMFMNDAGKVGIGTNGPVANLTVEGSVSATGGGGYTFGTGGDTDGGLFSPADGTLTFRTNNSERMRIDSNGKVGIGTTAPRCPLEIGIATSITYTGDDYSTGSGWVNPGGTGLYTNNVSIYSNNWIACSAIQTFSDQRVKTDIHPTDNKSDLQTLMGIEISDYKYKDSRKFGAKPQKKVIAQQVAKVYPQAVAPSTDVVPDIFKKASVKAAWVKLATDLKVGERVRLINGAEQAVHEVLEVRQGAFRTDYKVDTDELFVYGREVNDFRTVDYDAIAMLNVSATQQIKKEKDLEIKALEEQNAGLQLRLDAEQKIVRTQEARIAALEARDQTLEAKHVAQQAEQNAKLAALERLLTRQLEGKPAVAVNRVSGKRPD